MRAASAASKPLAAGWLRFSRLFHAALQALRTPASGADFRPERAIDAVSSPPLAPHASQIGGDRCRIGFVGGINLIDDLHGRKLAAPRQDYAVRSKARWWPTCMSRSAPFVAACCGVKSVCVAGEDAWLKAETQPAGNNAPVS
jgi:hypothetical protein